MNGGRVLIVDDSIVFRKVLADLIGSAGDLTVVGTAANGSLGLKKVEELAPDVVTLDIEMPVMDGLSTLREIKKLRPQTKVVMFSTLTERGAAATIEALSAGASDYVTKPTSSGTAAESMERIKEQLLPKLRALAGIGRRRPATAPAPRPATRPQSAPSHSTSRIDIVAIGTSTGGPNALAEVMPGLKKDLGVPIVIVQHMPPVFTRFLAERLDQRSELRIVEATDGQVLAPGMAYIAPGNFHMVVRTEGSGAVLRLNQDPPENFCRPAVDPLFRSVAKIYGSRALAVVLTGMGHDGTAGCQAIVGAGGRVLAQDESTSVVWGMPGSVSDAGLADKLIPLGEVAAEITAAVKRMRDGAPTAFANRFTLGSPHR